jgi:hypothetical protein
LTTGGRRRGCFHLGSATPRAAVRGSLRPPRRPICAAEGPREMRAAKRTCWRRCGCSRTEAVRRSLAERSSRRRRAASWLCRSLLGRGREAASTASVFWGPRRLAGRGRRAWSRRLGESGLRGGRPGRLPHPVLGTSGFPGTGRAGSGPAARDRPRGGGPEHGAPGSAGTANAVVRVRARPRASRGRSAGAWHGGARCSSSGWGDVPRAHGMVRSRPRSTAASG